MVRKNTNFAWEPWGISAGGPPNHLAKKGFQLRETIEASSMANGPGTDGISIERNIHPEDLERRAEALRRAEKKE
jgi:hypothetical protein